MVIKTISYKGTLNLFDTIANSDITYMKRYSSYSLSYRRTIKTIANELLNVISGGDKYSLLNELLEPSGVAKLYPCDQIMQEIRKI